MVGSLMLGLYDGDNLAHVGVIGSFPTAQRRSLVEKLAPLRDPGAHPWVRDTPDDNTGGVAVSGGRSRPAPPASRWNAGKDTSFEPLLAELVVEAGFEQLQGRRLRHAARFGRWRPDRDPRSATFDQLDVAVPAMLDEVFAAGRLS
jgi:ATP-dependent DNA ligase